jgi:serine/threonine protein kinase
LGVSLQGGHRGSFGRRRPRSAAASRPHICPLFDVGRQGDIDFLVMEYVEGETLAARLARGPLPVAQALAYARAMADALGHAHRRGIVHRDVKPANVTLTKDGLKLLDFGLARVIERAPCLESSLEKGSPLGRWSRRSLGRGRCKQWRDLGP